ncbi:MULTISPECIES: hypothetical protein [unclassified Pannonibacter]|uniref:hypothetical protein n=1 Tax=unclassified Pannonibacter TaxID=2627228 RepID=UPI0016449A29|nr:MULTISPECIES: hypothetical protein [unclassified Pannonibacter]
MIEKVRWRGHNVLKLTGSIDDELVTEFMSARDHAEVWPHGAQVLLLDSPGGGVMAALAIVNLMDQGTWQTVIPNGVKFIEAMPLIMPADPMVTRVFLYIPPEALIHFLKKTREFVFHVDFKKPFTAMRATTQLAGSRKNLIFAANHCGTKAFGLDGQPIE